MPLVDPLARFALRSVVADERFVLSYCKERHGAAVAPRGVRRAIRHTEHSRGLCLSGEQRQAVEAVLSDSHAVSVVTGVPGAGKTTVVAAIARGFTDAGFTVCGLAHTGVAAQNLGQEAGVRSSTVASFLASIARGSRFREAPAVLICDEASQLDTERLSALVRFARQHTARVVLIGDPHQQGAVEAGGLFAEIVGERTTAQLQENRRQRSAHEVAAVALIRRG